MDIETLQYQLENIAFGELHEEDLRLHPDITIVKAFKLAQLIIEYLLNVQDTLALHTTKLAEGYQKLKCKY